MQTRRPTARHAPPPATFPAARLLRAATAATLAASFALSAHGQNDLAGTADAPVALDLPALATPAPAKNLDPNALDFSQPIVIFQNATSPLKNEVAPKVAAFRQDAQLAQGQFDQGDLHGAIDTLLGSIDTMLANRDDVVPALIAGQEAMLDFMEPLRADLAKFHQPQQPQGQGLERFDDATQAALLRMATQYQSARSDRARRLLQLRIESKIRLAELKLKADAVAELRGTSKHQMLLLLDRLQGVLEELSVKSELAFSTLEGQADVLRAYREVLGITDSVKDIQAQLNAGFGEGGIEGFIGEIDTLVDGMSQAFGDEVTNRLHDIDPDAFRPATAQEQADFQTTLDDILQLGATN